MEHFVIKAHVILAVCLINCLLAQASPEQDDLYGYDVVEDEEEEGDDISRFAFVPEDDREVSKLEGQYELFYDFCIWARDHVARESKKNINITLVEVFKFLFKGAEELVLKILEVQNAAVDRLSEQMLNPSLPIVFPPKAEIPDLVVNQGLKKIQEGRLQPQLVATLSVFGAIGTQLIVSTQERIFWLVNHFGHGIIDSLERVCHQFNDLNVVLKKRFKEVREQLAKTDSSYEEILYKDVKCLTTQRISKLDRFCAFLRLVKDQGKQLLDES